MAALTDLPPDQKAVLQLLLKQDRGYDEIAEMLRLDREAVRARAHRALETLGPSGTDLAAERRAELSDYLLGEQTASQRARTRAYLEGSAAGRAWARATAAELRPLGGDALPEIPADEAEVDEAFDALQARTARREEVQRSSRIGGVLLIAAAAIVVVAGVILLTSILGDDEGGDSSRAGSTGTRTSTQPAGDPQVLLQANLRPARQGSKAIAVATIIEQQGQRALGLVAQNLEPTTDERFYALWFGRGDDVRFAGFTPQVEARGENRRRLRLLDAVPEGVNPEAGQTVILSRERVSRDQQRPPARPSTVVLRGAFGRPQEGGGG